MRLRCVPFLKEASTSFVRKQGDFVFAVGCLISASFSKKLVWFHSLPIGFALSGWLPHFIWDSNAKLFKPLKGDYHNSKKTKYIRFFKRIDFRGKNERYRQ
jgi:hypothetical protein